MSTTTKPNTDAAGVYWTGPQTTSTRKTAVFVGLLFLTATAAFIFAEALDVRGAASAEFSGRCIL